MGTKDKSLALERYMRLYPLARALRGALHMDVQKGDPNVDEIKLSLTHWKETQRLKDALVSKEQTVSTLHRERLKQQGSIDSLAEENRQLKEQTQRLEGAVEELRMQQSRLVSEAVIPARPLSTARPKYAPQQPVMTGKHAPSEHTLRDYVQRFLRYEAEHTVQSEKTREARENYLMRFLDIVGHELPLSELTPDRCAIIVICSIASRAISTSKALSFHKLSRNDQHGLSAPSVNGQAKRSLGLASTVTSRTSACF